VSELRRGSEKERRRTGLTYIVRMSGKIFETSVVKIEAANYKVNVRGDIIFKKGLRRVAFFKGETVDYIYIDGVKNETL